MAWYQAVMTIALGNIIVLIPMVLNGHAGTKYGMARYKDDDLGSSPCEAPLKMCGTRRE